MIYPTPYPLLVLDVSPSFSGSTVAAVFMRFTKHPIESPKVYDEAALGEHTFPILYRGATVSPSFGASLCSDNRGIITWAVLSVRTAPPLLGPCPGLAEGDCWNLSIERGRCRILTLSLREPRTRLEF